MLSPFVVAVGEVVLEALNVLGDVGHHFRNPAPSKQQNDNRRRVLPWGR